MSLDHIFLNNYRLTQLYHCSNSNSEKPTEVMHYKTKVFPKIHILFRS